MKIKIFPFASIALLTSIFMLTSLNAAAAIKIKKVPAIVLTTLMQKELEGVKIHLNNFGPKHGWSWYKGNDSYIKLPSNLGGNTSRFSFPALNKFPYRYYINDVNSGRIRVYANPNRFFNVRIPFEESGIEIKGMCSSKNVAKNALCITGADRAAPDIHISGMAITISMTLKPSADKRSITIGSMQAKFQARTIRIGRNCTLGQGICQPLGGLKQVLEREVSKRFANIIKTSRIYSAIENGMRPTIQRLGIRRVLGVWLSRGELLISYQ